VRPSLPPVHSVTASPVSSRCTTEVSAFFLVDCKGCLELRQDISELPGLDANRRDDIFRECVRGLDLEVRLLERR
jgi:predicted Fe-S protein YdhL (DUF1289 family)